MDAHTSAKEKTDKEIYHCIKEGQHEIRDMHDYKNECCIICNKVFNKKTGEFVGYRSVIWQ